MASPYTSVSVTGYNDNPPSDDGSESEENRIYWATIKQKLPDPLKTALESVNTNVASAFGKIVGGAGVTSTGISATVGASDQGKLYRATGSGGITITTPDATAVDDPFWFALLNSASASITLDGNGSQTVNGAASITIQPAGGGLVATDGSDWFYIGVSGSSIGPGQIVNGTIAESNATNAVTFAVKTLAGADPSAGDPVFACFRNATQATGDYVFRAVTSALSITIPSGATMGASNNVAFDINLWLVDDAGTIRLGVINATNRAIAKALPIASSLAIDTGSDTANFLYTDAAVTSKAYVPFAVARYPSGLATAGVWNVSPTTLQLYGPDAPAPNGPTYQTLTSGSGATYTTPAGCRLLRIRMCGGGGGGAAGNTNNGSNGGDTSFGSWTSIHGNGGQVNSTFNAAGGTGGVNSVGTVVVRLDGGNGAGFVAAGGTTAGVKGGSGGTNHFGGAGHGGAGVAGTAAKANTGGGGGGGASGNSAGSGGGAGEFVEFTIAGPAATYTYTVGAGGAGGSAGGTAGGAGGSGVIIVEEWY